MVKALQEYSGRKLQKLKELVLSLEPDLVKIRNRAVNYAAIRGRKKLQEIRKLSKALRQDIQDTVKEVDIKLLENS